MVRTYIITDGVNVSTVIIPPLAGETVLNVNVRGLELSVNDLSIYHINTFYSCYS